MLGVLPAAALHPPVAHGDLLRLNLVGGDVVVVIDGYYHQRASVRHKEILALLSEGVTVIGCASMGALRAAELANFGMIGNGAVYRMYRDGVLDADDEVAVAHGPAPDYANFTVPMVVVRHAVGMAVQRGALDEADAVAVMGAARELHYTERSWPALERAVDVTDSSDGAVLRLRKFIDSSSGETNIKVGDALDTLRKVANGELPGDRQSRRSWMAGNWRNRYVDEWRNEFTVSLVDGIEVGQGDVIRCQQLYRDDFPNHWQRFVLGRIAGGASAEDCVAKRAHARAADRGLRPDSLTERQRAYWLTEPERARLSADEALTRVLVRSYQSVCPTYDLALDQQELVDDAAARRMVAEAVVVNAEVASWADKRTVGHLKEDSLRAHLAQTWQLDDANPAELLAAARDRGFASVGEAADAARVFFLSKTFLRAAG